MNILNLDKILLGLSGKTKNPLSLGEVPTETSYQEESPQYTPIKGLGKVSPGVIENILPREELMSSYIKSQLEQPPKPKETSPEEELRNLISSVGSSFLKSKPISNYGVSDLLQTFSPKKDAQDNIDFGGTLNNIFSGVEQLVRSPDGQKLIASMQSNPFAAKALFDNANQNEAITKQQNYDLEKTKGLTALNALVSSIGASKAGLQKGTWYDPESKQTKYTVFNPKTGKFDKTDIIATDPFRKSVSEEEAARQLALLDKKNAYMNARQDKQQGFENSQNTMRSEEHAAADISNDSELKKYSEHRNAARGVITGLNAKNPIFDEAIKIQLARAVGDTGALSNQDVKRWGGSKAIRDRIEQAFKESLDGRLSDTNRKWLFEVATALENKAIANNNARVSQLTKARSSTGFKKNLSGVQSSMELKSQSNTDKKEDPMGIL